MFRGKIDLGQRHVVRHNSRGYLSMLMRDLDRLSARDYDELKRQQDQRLTEDLTPRPAPPSRSRNSEAAQLEQLRVQLVQLLNWLHS